MFGAMGRWDGPARGEDLLGAAIAACYCGWWGGCLGGCGGEGMLSVRRDGRRDGSRWWSVVGGWWPGRGGVGVLVGVVSWPSKGGGYFRYLIKPPDPLGDSDHSLLYHRTFVVIPKSAEVSPFLCSSLLVCLFTLRPWITRLISCITPVLPSLLLLAYPRPLDGDRRCDR